MRLGAGHRVLWLEVVKVLADIVLIVHTLIAVFVVAGLPIIVAGNIAGANWVNAWWFRLTHLASIAVIVAQAWLGMVCPLTTLEMWLRRKAGQVSYEESFIEHWLSELLFYEAPGWVFTVVYSGFGILVALVWWRYPPSRRPNGHP